MLFDQSSGGTGGSTKKSFPSKLNDKNEKEVHTSSAPTSRYQQQYASAAPIYQLIAPRPPLLAYQAPYPPPSVYHPPQQYPTNSPNANRQQNLPQVNPQRNSNKFTRSFTPLPEPLSWLYHKLVEHQYHNQDPTEAHDWTLIEGS